MALKRAGTLLFYTTIQVPLTCLAESHVQHLAETRSLPGREIGGEWHFSRQDCRIGYGDYRRVR